MSDRSGFLNERMSFDGIAGTRYASNRRPQVQLLEQPIHVHDAKASARKESKIKRTRQNDVSKKSF